MLENCSVVLTPTHQSWYPNCARGPNHKRQSIIMIPQNWVHLLVGIKPKDTTKPKSRKRKDLLFAKVRGTPGIFPKAVSPQTAKLGKFSGNMHIHEGAWAVHAYS